MNWLLANLLLLIIIILIFWVGLKKDITWGSRIRGWILLTLPIPIYMLVTGYFTAYYQHVHDCKTDSGLKVLIQPEKAEQVQLRSYGEPAAQSYLHEFYPELKKVEALGDHKESRIKPYQFFSYSVASTSTSNRSSNWQEEWVFNKTPLREPSEDIYVISEHREDSGTHNKISKYEWTLTRNDHLYAKVTNYIHHWTGVRYPDSVPFWSCWNRYSEEYAYPEEDLIKLILK